MEDHPQHDIRQHPAPQGLRLPQQGNGLHNTRLVMRKDFPVVCVGGSAGGLDAYIRLLKCLPVDLGVAVVIVNHMTRMPTQLHTILPNYTAMSLGNRHSCMLDTAGAAWCWGSNEDGSAHCWGWNETGALGKPIVGH